MQRVERYVVSKSTNKAEYMALAELCYKTKNLYNYVTYILRQCYLNKLDFIPDYVDLVTTQTKTVKAKKVGENDKTYVQNFIREFDLSKRLCVQKQIDYAALKAQVSQQTIALCFRNFKAFFKAMADYSKNPSKYLGKPKLPKYKDKNGLSIATFTNQCATIDKNGYLKLAKDCVLHSVKTSCTKKDFKQARIIPRLDCFIVEIVYDKVKGQYIEKATKKNKKTYIAAIDIGVDNLATITSDNVDAPPLIVNGRPLKSINQFYNKKLAHLNYIYSLHKKHTGKQLKRLNDKRNFIIEDYIHKASRRVVDYCILNDIGVLYIGHNDGWKQKPRMGKKAKQTFVQIPFNKFIQKVTYKCEEVGIKVGLVQEAYTSKCSALDDEHIGFHRTYAGQRLKRGMFQTKSGKLLNADVNGSLNILRLSKDQSSIDVSSKVFNPFKLKTMNELCDAAYFDWQSTDRGYVFQPCNREIVKDLN